MKKYVVQWGKNETVYFNVRKAVSFAEKTGLETGLNVYVWVDIDGVRDREPLFKAEWEM